jgi:ribonuclease Z
MFSAALINNPTGDPGVYVEFKYRREAFLFDLGDISLLPPRKILKIRYVFISHTHMDHFIGFDHLLRICLGRNQHISLFGPPGFLEKVESKLRAYTWNLVENYTNDFELSVTEVHETHRASRRYRCRNAFRPEGEERREQTDSILAEGDFFFVRGVLLDHSIPCLAFRFEEKTRLNIKKNILREMELPTGAWLTGLKEQILNEDPDEAPVRVWWKNEEGKIEETALPLGMLKERAVKITPGQIVCYVTDVIWSDENVGKIVELARDAELLFIEAPFLHEEVETAAKKYHLTARQAGALAAMAGVKRLVPFHFSPKYKGAEEALQKEAMNSFQDKKNIDNGEYIL